MNKKVLVYNQPKFSTYNYLCAAGIVGQNNPYCDIWYYNNYIEIQCCRTDFTKGLNLTFSQGDILGLPFLCLLSLGTLTPLNKLYECIKNLIDDDFYVYFSNVDDYYISGKSHYMEKHFAHDGLIFGYDETNKTYDIAAYNEDFLFKPFSTPQKHFAEGFSYGFFRAYESGKMPKLYGVKVDKEKPEYYVDINVAYINQQIKSYLYPQTDESQKASPEYAFGIDVYESITKYLELLKDNMIGTSEFMIDARLFKMLHEHKVCMRDRIEYLSKHCGIQIDTTPYCEIVRKTDKLRLLYAKLFKDKKIRVINDIIMQLMNIKDMEIKALQSYLGNSTC